MLALARSARDSVDACFDAVREANRSPLAAVLVAATEMTRYVKSPEEMSNHLAFLQTDLSDPDFYAVMLENSRRIIDGYRRLLDEAVAARELVRCDTARLARAVDALAGGSLIGWAVSQRGRRRAGSATTSTPCSSRIASTRRRVGHAVRRVADEAAGEAALTRLFQRNRCSWVRGRPHEGEQVGCCNRGHTERQLAPR